jgi:hypothetical protein
VQLEGLGKLKKSIHLVGSRTHDLPACSIIIIIIIIIIPFFYALTGQPQEQFTEIAHAEQ